MCFGKNKNGFGIVEGIISMVLIGIVSVVGAQSLAQYQHMALRSSRKFIAANFARAKMEDIYMNGSWVGGSDHPQAGMTRTWSSQASHDPNSYTITQVTISQ